jgi:hypothetical protein
MDKKNNHGGKRKGAGKPALFDKPMKRRNVMLDERTVELLRQLVGGGNLSAGIREAVNRIYGNP